MQFGVSIFFYTGLRYSSPTLASATINLSLAFTFIVAIIFRMEILNLRSQSRILKLIGTIVSISGA
ncbi:WAT1-related protein At3g28050-like, partial [Chenopodium quinoa]|uniref:WAT1-related protein At3g28050-like n=1 Tax=Chenopodium quinoa TaxID=63459 RepID=UPI000B771458